MEEVCIAAGLSSDITTEWPDGLNSIAVILVVRACAFVRFFTASFALLFEFAGQRIFDDDVKLNLGGIFTHFVASQRLALTVDEKLAEVPVDINSGKSLLRAADKTQDRNGVASVNARQSKE